MASLQGPSLLTELSRLPVRDVCLGTQCALEFGCDATATTTATCLGVNLEAASRSRVRKKDVGLFLLSGANCGAVAFSAKL